MIKAIHKGGAIFLGVFLITHIGCHLFALGGPEMHMKALETIQWIYRNPIIEPILLITIAMQIYSGISFVRIRLKEKQKPFWGWVQVISGVYIAGFLLMHTSAALATRHIFGLDTNFYWAAGTVVTDPILWGFRPYYFFGVMAVFAHVAAAIYFVSNKRIIANLLVGAGFLVSVLIVASLSGAFYEIELPHDYKALFEKYAAMI